MHPNTAFRGAPEAETVAFARSRGFGVLTLAAHASAPLAAHIPFVLDAEGARASFHLVRSNPIAQLLRGGPQPALLIVSGPDAYVSPDWYGLGPDQVPTWNYVAAHLRGEVRLLDPDRLRPHLDEASACFEARLAPKPPWRVEKMSEDAFARLARAIVPAELRVDQIDATWKLSQNKPAEAQGAAGAAMAAAAAGASGAAEIAALMRPDVDD